MPSSQMYLAQRELSIVIIDSLALSKNQEKGRHAAALSTCLYIAPTLSSCVHTRTCIHLPNLTKSQISSAPESLDCQDLRNTRQGQVDTGFHAFKDCCTSRSIPVVPACTTLGFAQFA